MVQKKYFGSNWKMYKTIAETVDYLRTFRSLRSELPSDLFLFQIPSYTALPAAAEVLKGSDIHLGGQNIHWEDQGAYTGDISPVMLKEIGCEIAEIGHSERRQYYLEDDYSVNRKTLTALRHGFIALVCIGEKIEDKEFGVSDEVLARQTKIAMHGVAEKDLSRVLLAYEPVWAIGEKGIPAKPEYANDRQGAIRAAMKQLYGTAGAEVPVLYGGSVNLENANELIVQPEIDGLFVGRTAWEAKRFIGLIKDALKTIGRA